MFTEGQPEYGSHKKKEKDAKEFIRGMQFAGMKAANAELAQKAQMLMAKELEMQQTEMKVQGMMEGLGQMQDQVGQHINSLPVLPINPMAGGLPPAGARPPLPMGQPQQNTAPSFA